MDTTWLNLAIQAAERNDVARARELLRGYVRYHPKDDQGWLWLSRVAETSTEQRWAMQQLQNASSRVTPAVSQSNITARSKSGAIPRAALKPATTSAPKAKLPAPSRATARNRIAWRSFAQTAIFGVAAILFFVVAIAVIPMFLGARTLVVLSGSMEPAIPKGAAAIAQAVPSKSLQIGDVIIFSPSADAQIPIIHRIVNIREKNATLYYTTKGDANNSSDPSEISLPATAWKVGFNVALVGYVISFASSPLGIVLLIALPIVALIALSVFDAVKKNRPPFSVMV